jgi:hypothetical protein
MKTKRSLMIVLLLLFAFGLPACDEDDYDTVAKLIEQTSAVAYNEVVAKNPDMEKPLGDLARFSIQMIDSQPIDVLQAKKLLYSALNGFTTLDESDKRIIVDMFSIVIPLIDLPQDGTLQKPQRMFVRAFFQGVLNAVEIKEELKTPAEVNDKLARLLD